MERNKLFLTVVQESDFKKQASKEQLLCEAREEIEELVDDYGYEEILSGEHDDELCELLGEELFQQWLDSLRGSSDMRQQAIAFINGLGFEILDLIVILETECSISSDIFTSEIIKKMEKQLYEFPMLGDMSIFDLTMEEVDAHLLRITNGKIGLYL
ncbi:hypothetical protein MUG87_07805 [Ectobacillus sp. JY-23]|uniref:hypothetical protein n=1 Tax=Ectobacillus sp. JY-23 TaxID=2933872 RepID=UPI001FF19080|nr:hypothetical protein [Ectobacillus sp. JY-23]UOY94002.1 hypothetical protein MUG87_07805 [Ectobacillus sp. JY-23]